MDNLGKISFVVAVHNLETYETTRKCIERSQATDIIEIRGASSLFTSYDEAWPKAKNDIVCFVHDDVQFSGIDEEQIFEKFSDEKTGFLGAAGTRCLYPTGIWWSFDSRSPWSAVLSGSCRHRKGDKDYVSEFGPCGEVVVLDGLLLISSKTVLADIGGFSEPPLDGFHFYDISATFRAKLKGYRNYTIPMNILHLGLGHPPPEWEENRQKFLKKYSRYLPYTL